MVVLDHELDKCADEADSGPNLACQFLLLQPTPDLTILRQVVQDQNVVSSGGYYQV